MTSAAATAAGVTIAGAAVRGLAAITAGAAGARAVALVRAAVVERDSLATPLAADADPRRREEEAAGVDVVMAGEAAVLVLGAGGTRAIGRAGELHAFISVENKV